MYLWWKLKVQQKIKDQKEAVEGIIFLVLLKLSIQMFYKWSIHIPILYTVTCLSVTFALTFICTSTQKLLLFVA